MPNHFLIQIGTAHPFISGPDDAILTNKEHYYVFLHEYWHYLQNITTVAGCKSFGLVQQIAAHFTHTLTSGQQSKGNSALPPVAAERIPSIIDLYQSLEGDHGPRGDWTERVTAFKVLNISETDAKIEIDGGFAPNPVAKIDVHAIDIDGKPWTGSFDLGSLAIEESVACMIDEQNQIQLFGACGDALPAFPYRTVETILEWISSGRKFSSRFYPAALGTLALLTFHPGIWLIRLGRDFEAMRQAGASEDAALNSLVATRKEKLRLAIDGFMRADLPEMIRMYQGRGLMAGAIKYICGVLQRGLERRYADPLFDIRSVFYSSPAQNLTKLTGEFPPCDVLQELPDLQVVPRDRMYCLDPTPPDEDGFSPTDFTRVLQAQQHFVYTHLNEAEGTFMASTSASARSACPFYSACPLEFRRTHGIICRNSPWKAYKDSENGCWYKVATLGAFGLVKINKIRR